MSDKPKGFTCECGKVHEFSLYVFAHCGETLTHKCEKCSREHEIWRGKVSPASESKPAKKVKVAK